MSLTDKKCVPCEGGTKPLDGQELQTYLSYVSDWKLEKNQIKKKFEFKNFVEAMKFLNQVAELAEDEGHHPDFCVYYKTVDVTLWTHAIGGLSQNDFILAAKMDQIKV